MSGGGKGAAEKEKDLQADVFRLTRALRDLDARKVAGELFGEDEGFAEELVLALPRAVSVALRCLAALADRLAEAFAEYVHQLVRTEVWKYEGPGDLTIEQLIDEAYRGIRPAFGYPACPDLDEHGKLFQLLPADQIGVTLTDAFQLVPEQSTAAIVVHHPEAKYFAIGSGRERAEEDVEAAAA